MDDLFSTPLPGKPAGAFYAFFCLVILLGLAVNVVILASGKLKRLKSRALLERLRGKSWSLGESAWVLLAVMFAWLTTASVGLLMQRIGVGVRAVETAMQVAWTVLAPALVIAALASIAREKGVSLVSWSGLEQRQLWVGVRQGVLFYIMAIPVVLFYSMVYFRMLQLLGQATDQPQDVVQFMMDPAGPTAAQIYLAVAAVSIMPVAEELFFRGVLLPLTARHARLSVALCFVSILFAVVHWHLPSVVPLALIAFAVSLGYLYSGSIVVPVVMHAAFNAMNLGLILSMR